jgi:uncharacterized protein YwqG
VSEAMLLPPHRLVLAPWDTPVTARVTKLGGQPVWIDEPAWPLSASLGTPMQFIGQVLTPATEQVPERMAYLFLSHDDDEDVPDTWETQSGENALICQPGRVADFVETTSLEVGPTVAPDVQVALVALDDQKAAGSYVGGSPSWLQRDETPAGFSFLFQLDSTELPFWVNFGGNGVGYAFIDPATGEGRFLYQCT